MLIFVAANRLRLRLFQLLL